MRVSPGDPTLVLRRDRAWSAADGIIGKGRVILRSMNAARALRLRSGTRPAHIALAACSQAPAPMLARASRQAPWPVRI
jgi:hypothetical protein